MQMNNRDYYPPESLDIRKEASWRTQTETWEKVPTNQETSQAQQNEGWLHGPEETRISFVRCWGYKLYKNQQLEE